jgi:hypothetical protein
MRMSTVGRWRIAAMVSLFGLGLFHCTFGDLHGLGAGAPDAAVAHESGGGDALADVGSSDDSEDASPGDTGSVADSGSHDADASPSVTDSGAPDSAETSVDAADAAPDGPWVPASDPPTWLEAGAASWCTMYGFGSTFCADFDESPLPAGFSGSDSIKGANLIVTSSLAQLDSLGNDLLVWVPPNTATTVFDAKVSRLFDTPVSSIVLSFDILPEYINTTASGILFAALDFTQRAVPSAYSVRLAYNAGSPRLEESFLGGEPADIPHKSFTLPVGVWSRVQININFVGLDGGGSAMEAISVGGVAQGLPETLSPPSGFSSIPNLLIGAVYGTFPVDGWSIRYDNVLLTLQ